MEAAGALTGLCAVVAVAAVLALPPKDERISPEDERLPLAAYELPRPDESALPYGGDGSGIIIPDFGLAPVPVKMRDAAIVLPNPEKNSYGFVFEIYLRDTGETLYNSGLVEPGNCVENPALTRELSKGGHEAALLIRFYDESGLASGSGAEIQFVLLVE